MAENPAPSTPTSNPVDVSIEARLGQALIFIKNAADAEVAPLMAGYNYDAARLTEGQARYDTALAKHAAQQQEYGEQYGATAAALAAQKAANRLYIRHVELARLAFKGDPTATQGLGLSGERKRTLMGWLGQAQAFYINLLGSAEYQAGLTHYGRTLAELEAGRDLVNAAGVAMAQQDKEKGEAQKATQVRDEALEALDAWLSEAAAVARLALADDPQLLEKLGMVAPS